MNRPEQSNSYLYILFSICFISGMLAATISTLMSSYLPIVVKEFSVSGQGELEEKSAVISAVFLYGWMLGGVAWGIICDKSGRKKALIYATVCFGLFAVLTAMASSWLMLVCCRFFSGFGVGGVIVTTTVFISEAWPASKRAVAIGFLTICFPVGVFLSGAITYFIPEWRVSFFAGVVPIVLAVIALLVLKEPNINNKTVTTIRNNTLGNLLFNKSNSQKLISGAVVFGAMLIGLWAIFTWLPTWIQGIILKTDGRKEGGLAMMSLAGAALIGGSLSGWLSLTAGWKRTMMACFFVCFLMSFILFKLTKDFSNLIYLEIALLGFFFGISQGILSDYLSKIFTAEIRATAIGFCFNAGRLFTATVVFFVGWLVNNLGGYGNSIFVFSWVFMVGFITTFFIKDVSEVKAESNN